MQFRDLKSQYRALKPQMDEAIQAVLHSSAYIAGDQVEELEKELDSVNSYDSRWNLYNYKMLGKFVEEFDKKGIKCATYVCLQFASASERKQFLEDTQVLLDAYILRFDKSDTQLSLLFAKEGEPETLRQLARAGVTEDMIIELRPVDYDYNGPLAEQLKDYIAENNHG